MVWLNRNQEITEIQEAEMVNNVKCFTNTCDIVTMATVFLNIFRVFLVYLRFNEN